MTKNNKKVIEQIEQNVQKEYPNERYRAIYETIVDIEMQNRFLATKAGKNAVGSEKAMEIIEKNKVTMEGKREELDFIAKYVS